ncbi:PGPGW domain-containing protein [Nocardioides sp. SYSU D00038]|uniref:PGPGW domain-containing protein n=1 Tax=Nocardioides sp. SYSU D00038 TaxID=2812554 RepID=UPI001967862E|nr:PGPGW domain-containing protein [Nocardioides sp. SYSU D00038]
MSPRTVVRRVAREGAAWVLVVLGVVLWPLPGPGLLVLFVGLALLSQHYEWADRRVDRVRLRAVQGVAHGVVTTWRGVGTGVGALALTAAGLLWIWVPPQPDWWPLPDWTWFPGGLWAGVGQVVTGLAGVVLVWWAWRRYHGDPAAVAALDAELAEARGRVGGRVGGEP